jgi:effector-binding domain-containing protein
MKMYKPAKIREFVTVAIHKRVVKEVINNRTKKTVQTIATVRGKFKLKGTSEISANGLTVVNDKTTFITWYKADYASKDILSIGGVDYQIIGTPENTENRGRYSVLNLERISGGA